MPLFIEQAQEGLVVRPTMGKRVVCFIITRKNRQEHNCSFV